METLEQIRLTTEELSTNTTKFFGGNDSAGTRARNAAQDLRKLADTLRKEILAERKRLKEEKSK
jgi:hypothetical protein